MARPPLDRSAIWPYEGGDPAEFFYARYGHPTGEAAEQALGELEGGRALLFPSGSGAITALVLALLEPGKTIAIADGAYYGMQTFDQHLLTLYREGRITMRDAMAAATSPHDFRISVRAAGLDS